MSILALVVILAACGGIAAAPTPTPTATPVFVPAATATATATSPAPTPTTTPEEHVDDDADDHGEDLSEGHAIFIATGCAACHGQNAEGSSIAPGLSGHTAKMVSSQVRSPVGAMPMFPPQVLSDGDLGKIIEFILGLEGAHAHVPSEDITQEVALHHWMALLALQFDDVPEAIHHVEHINELITGEHLHQMEEVLSSLEEGHNHDAAHTIETMLTGFALPDLPVGVMHLRLALAAVNTGDGASAIHHTEHFMETATGPQREAAGELLQMLEAGDLHDAEHDLEHLMGETAGEDAHN